MRYQLSLLLLGLIGVQAASAQCDGRYRWDVFTGVDVSTDIQYGSNIDFEGNLVDLYMDFYEPVGDTETERPLVILAHGGFFVVGDKTAEDIVGLCDALARKGYACASMQYRLGIGLDEVDSIGFAKAVVRGVQDGKAAVRFFRENASTYGIDEDQIFLGGTSAGGVLAVHLAYLKDTTLTPSWVNSIITDLGGLEGSSGSPGQSSEIKAAVSYAGAIKDVSWIGSNPIPLASTHGTEDPIVPYGLGMVTYIIVPGILEVPITRMSGSSLIHAELDARGVPNDFWSVEGAGHVIHLEEGSYTLHPDRFPQTVVFTADFLHRQLDCYAPSGLGDPVVREEVAPYPNPADGYSMIDSKPGGPMTCHLYDASGRLLRSWTANITAPIAVYREDLPAGLYLFRGTDAQGKGLSARITFR